MYVELESIGRGSFGEVKKVRRRSDQKTLVCKVLSYGSMSEKEKQLVVSEVNILRELRHPNIVRYFDRVIDKTSAKIYIVMEYCEGGDLGQCIKRKRAKREYFEESRVWRALSQLLLAFEECHYRKDGRETKPILHRDVKPCNIFLDSSGNIKVGDFGLAKELGDENRFAYTNVGTPYYMSPELIKEMRYNQKSDIWSIGCLIYEMASLRPPFQASNVVSLGKKITTGKFTRIPSMYSDDLHNIIKAMLTLNPLKRPSVTQLMGHPRLVRYLNSRKVELNTKHLSTEDSEHAKQKKKMQELAAREEEIKKRELAIEEKEAQLRKREQDLKKRESAFEEKIELSSKKHDRGRSPSETSTTTCSTSTSSCTTKYSALSPPASASEKKLIEQLKKQRLQNRIAEDRRKLGRTPESNVYRHRDVENISPTSTNAKRTSGREKTPNFGRAVLQPRNYRHTDKTRTDLSTYRTRTRALNLYR